MMAKQASDDNPNQVQVRAKNQAHPIQGNITAHPTFKHQQKTLPEQRKHDKGNDKGDDKGKYFNRYKDAMTEFLVVSSRLSCRSRSEVGCQRRRFGDTQLAGEFCIVQAARVAERACSVRTSPPFGGLCAVAAVTAAGGGSFLGDC